MPPPTVTKNDAAATLRRNRERATAFAHKAGGAPVRSLLERAQRDLLARIAQAEGLRGPGKDSFTAAQLRITLEQVRDVLHPLVQGMSASIVQSGVTAAQDETAQLVGYMRDADRAYRGVSQGLQINEAAIMSAAVSGTERSILTRIESDPTDKRRPGVLARYGASVIGSFEEELQQRFIAKTPWEDVKAAITKKSTFLQGQPAFWAERIVRTEVMNASNRAGLETIKAADEQLADMCKILCATFDSRTGADSYAVHGQIRRPTESFVSWFGSYQHPPNRPNDREIVVPHRVCWPLPPELLPKGAGEIAARWTLEGRKGSPPGQPLLSTIDRALFGKEPAPKVKELTPGPEPDQAPGVQPDQAQGDVVAPEPEPTALVERKPRRARIPRGATPVDNSDIELPLPSRMVQQTGFIPDMSAVGGQLPVFPGNRTPMQASGIAAIYRTPVTTGEHIAFDAGAHAGIKPAPKRGPAMPYAATLRALGKIADLVEANGEYIDISDSRLNDVQATKTTVDRRAVAALIAKPLPLFDVAPVYVKHDGKIYLHSGHEELMASHAAGASSSTRPSRLIDLDKMGSRPAPSREAVVSALKANVGSAAPADQKVVRETLRSQLRGMGVVTRDDRRGDPMGYSFPKSGRSVDDVKVQPTTGADAFHGWDGLVSITPETRNRASMAASMLEVNPDFAHKLKLDGYTPQNISDELDGIRILLHEEAHGASPATPPSYQGVGIGIEESITEIIARKAAREIVGMPEAWALPAVNTDSGLYEGGHWCYRGYINGLFDRVSAYTGDADIQARIEQAAIATRTWKRGEVYRTGREQIEDFAANLKNKHGQALTPAQRDGLISALSNPSGPMAP